MNKLLTLGMPLPEREGVWSVLSGHKHFYLPSDEAA
jgi:hypothetical protein